MENEKTVVIVNSDTVTLSRAEYDRLHADSVVLGLLLPALQNMKDYSRGSFLDALFGWGREGKTNA